MAAQLFTSAKYCASGQFVRCGAVGLVPLLAHSMPSGTRRHHGHRAVACNVQL
jgi:hypothetical protein